MVDDIRVLVVDDDFMVARVHRGYVASVPGFTVVGEANTAAAAMTAVADLRPDLVLLDLYLPDTDVADLMSTMLAPEMPCDVMVLSAANDLETVRTAFESGALHYLIKPFSRQDLAGRLTDYRRRRESWDRAVRDDGTVEQGAVDTLFGRDPRPPQQPSPPLPKGLAGPTLTLVRDALQRARDHGDGTLSATECADQVGLARVSARRYLEHLVTVGSARVEHRYGGAGRPERRYRWTAG